MGPKIVTRLANIAAKLAGSDKYDPTVETKTAFEYYLNKGVDKILAIMGVPLIEASDIGKVLTASNSGAPVWGDKGTSEVLFVTLNNGTLNKTMGEIQTAFLRGDSVILKELNDGFVDFTMTHLFEVYYDERGDEYLGSVHFDRRSFSVSGATEADALAAYPALDG